MRPIHQIRSNAANGLIVLMCPIYSRKIVPVSMARNIVLSTLDDMKVNKLYKHWDSD